MASIYDQLRLESGMVSFGKARTLHGYKSAEIGGRAGDTTYARILMKELLPDLIEYIETTINDTGARRFGKYKALLAMLDIDRAAYIALRGVFQEPFTDRTLPALAKVIGSMIEDEIKFSLFQEDHTEYYNTVIKDFKNKAVTSYRHRKRVLTFKLNEKGVAWREWSHDDKLHVGMILLDCILESTDLIKRIMVRKGRRTIAMIKLTAEANTWIEKHKDRMSLLSPVFMPCIVKPDDWVSLDIGGYYTPDMRRRTPLIKTRSKEHLELLKTTDISNILTGINKLQDTSWRVNDRVYSVIKEIWKKDLRIGMGSPNPIVVPVSPVYDVNKKDFTPEQQVLFDNWRRQASRLHTLENERIKKNFQILRILKSASDYCEYEKFWYIYQTDFRGRIYAASAGLSPQGPDIGRGLIEFSDAKIMGERGFYWMKVHFSNLAGNDKITYDERADYTDTCKKEIIDCAGEPLGRSKHLWADTDKPFCTLAALFELAEAYVKGPENTENRIAVAKDGSCNGLQHYAAILKDKEGATATNVIYEGAVEDIYSKVGIITMERINVHIPEEGDEELKEAWINHLNYSGVPRKLAKKPVMTLPYGSTKRSCTDSVIDYIHDVSDKEVFDINKTIKYSMYMTNHLWEGIGDVVKSARDAMTWLQKSAAKLAKAGHPIVWSTPTGFLVYQASNKLDVRRISTQLGGTLKISVGDFNSEFNPRKQSSGSAPNFVHSLDASHLLMTVLRGDDIDAWAMIHDSYGTYAADTDKLDVHIREAFVELYKDTNHLENFKNEQESRTGIELTDTPVQGDLNIKDVLNSPYFFG